METLTQFILSSLINCQKKPSNDFGVTTLFFLLQKISVPSMDDAASKFKSWPKTTHSEIFYLLQPVPVYVKTNPSLRHAVTVIP